MWKETDFAGNPAKQASDEAGGKLMISRLTLFVKGRNYH
jgi:hypothetical protein